MNTNKNAGFSLLFICDHKLYYTATLNYIILYHIIQLTIAYAPVSQLFKLPSFFIQTSAPLKGRKYLTETNSGQGSRFIMKLLLLVFCNNLMLSLM